MKVLLSKLTRHSKLIFWVLVIQWTWWLVKELPAQYTQLSARCLSSAVSSGTFVLPVWGCLLEETLFSLFTLFKPGIWMCQKAELLSGAEIQWILFTVYVAAVGNGIHSKTKVTVLCSRRGKQSVGQWQGAGEPPTADRLSHLGFTLSRALVFSFQFCVFSIGESLVVWYLF